LAPSGKIFLTNAGKNPSDAHITATRYNNALYWEQ